MKPVFAFLAVVLGLVALTQPALAVNPDEMLKNPKLEARARAISEELRCLVCQNQSIEDSNADLAHDLRVLVRDRVKAGDTDQQVLDYVVDRYGEFVLLKPVFAWHTLFLWIATPLVFVGGLIWLLFKGRRNGPQTIPPVALSPDEEEALKHLQDN